MAYVGALATHVLRRVAATTRMPRTCHLSQATYEAHAYDSPHCDCKDVCKYDPVDDYDIIAVPAGHRGDGYAMEWYCTTSPAPRHVPAA